MTRKSKHHRAKCTLTLSLCQTEDNHASGQFILPDPSEMIKSQNVRHVIENMPVIAAIPD